MSDSIQLLVGLGNPGAQYEKTRHNAGIWFLERMAERASLSLSPQTKHKALIGQCQWGRQSLRILVPTTFMNLSGQAVASYAQFLKIPTESILVVHDELDLAPGCARIKRGGGPGGHNGLKDIIQRLGNNRNFMRLRLGIGHPGHARLVSDYVLGKPPADDRALIDSAIDASLDALEDIVSGEAQRAMNQLHRFNAS